jgi:hypothetical protein
MCSEQIHLFAGSWHHLLPCPEKTSPSTRASLAHAPARAASNDVAEGRRIAWQHVWPPLDDWQKCVVQPKVHTVRRDIAQESDAEAAVQPCNLVGGGLPYN